MRKLPFLFSVLALAALPSLASAHTGSALDADGCHVDHRDNTYHCHRGDAAGYTFRNRAAMQEAVRTGSFPEKSVEVEGFWSKLWPFGDDEAVEKPASPADAAAAANPKQADMEKRLKVLQGLHEMGLITKEEYEARRKAILDEI
jgi:hypothetical protein